MMEAEENEMKYIDMHCDTVLEWLEQEERGTKPDFVNNALSVDLSKLQKGGCMVQNFALFTNLKKEAVPEKETMKLYDMYCRMLEENRDRVAPVLRYADIEKNAREGKISALLTLEEGDVVFGSLAMLRNYYRMGVRMIALTWNHPNAIGHPNFSMDAFDDYKAADVLQRADTKHGLNAFGIRYVREMERLGILIDVSHLSDAGFWDVVRHTTKPFVASHSNAHGVCPVARNLSDDMILALARRGGVMGLNFCGDFLKLDGTNKSRVEDMVAHIDYIKALAGVDVIGLGTDFDAIQSDLEIEDASQIGKLAQALRHHGYTEEEIEKIFYKNVLRVYQNGLE